MQAPQSFRNGGRDGSPVNQQIHARHAQQFFLHLLMQGHDRKSQPLIRKWDIAIPIVVSYPTFRAAGLFRQPDRDGVCSTRSGCNFASPRTGLRHRGEETARVRILPDHFRVDPPNEWAGNYRVLCRGHGRELWPETHVRPADSLWGFGHSEFASTRCRTHGPTSPSRSHSSCVRPAFPRCLAFPFASGGVKILNCGP